MKRGIMTDCSVVHLALVISAVISFITGKNQDFSASQSMERIISRDILSYISRYDVNGGVSTIINQDMAAAVHESLLTSTSAYFYFQHYNDDTCDGQVTYTIGYPTSECLVLYSAAEIAVGSVSGSCSGINYVIAVNEYNLNNVFLFFFRNNQLLLFYDLHRFCSIFEVL